LPSPSVALIRRHQGSESEKKRTQALKNISKERAETVLRVDVHEKTMTQHQRDTMNRNYKKGKRICRWSSQEGRALAIECNITAVAFRFGVMPGSDLLHAGCAGDSNMEN
jgi:hypothetical protein